ncbi:hypothetical protein [Pseudoxanthomonas winnipegensis]|uniref:hypothetical protein n=1 Tax=Pseudoxanthomonas winnipegensis TaxID=2480810 RepID=UPI003F8335B5
MTDTRPETPLPELIVSRLAPLIGAMHIQVASVLDRHGQRLLEDCVVIHDAESPTNPSVSLDSVAFVVECYDTLELDMLPGLYERTLALKLAHKERASATPAQAYEMTTTAVVARNTTHTLDEIAAAMGRLNASTVSQQWPDMIAVLSKGVISYTALLPGATASGMYFLAAKEFDGPAHASPMTVQLLVRPTGEKTLNAVLSYAVARAAIFRPTAGVSNYAVLLEGLPTHGLPIETYEFDLSGRLQPLHAQQAFEARLNFESFSIRNGKEALGTVKFFARQDGAVIVVEGPFPIDLILAFLSSVCPAMTVDHMRFIRRDGFSVSYVLPITRADFLRGLSQFAQRSANIRVDRHEPNIVVQQTGNEGTSSPFVARVWAGLMEVRDWAMENDAKRREFDAFYEHVTAGAQDVREARREIQRIWSTHANALAAGTIVSRRGAQTHFSESIDRPLSAAVDTLLIASTRIIKTALQKLTAHLGRDIGFLLRAENAFQTGLTRLAQTDPALAEYLAAARTWTEPLVTARNALEHALAATIKVEYAIDHQSVSVIEPELFGAPLIRSAEVTVERLLCFVEETVVHCLGLKVPASMGIHEIPVAARDANFPRRFQLTVRPGGLPLWELPGRVGEFHSV